MSEHYYQDAQVTLYHGNCLDVLPALPKGSVDLVVTDPPYGVNWQSNKRISRLARIEGDRAGATELTRSAIVECLRLLRGQRHLYVFGRPELSDLAIGATCELVWDKCMVGPGDLSQPWGPSWEPITFAVHVSRPAGRARGDGRLSARLRKASVLRVPRANAGELEDARRPHPTAKPVHLIRQLIESSSMLGELVLDPFAGGGSTLLAAVAEGRRAIGVEIDEAYCDRIATKLSGSRDLFGGAA